MVKSPFWLIWFLYFYKPQIIFETLLNIWNTLYTRVNSLGMKITREKIIGENVIENWWWNHSDITALVFCSLALPTTSPFFSIIPNLCLKGFASGYINTRRWANDIFYQNVMKICCFPSKHIWCKNKKF